MKKFLSFLFTWLLAWGAPLIFWEGIPIIKKVLLLPEYILGIGFLVLVGFFVEERRRRKKRARDDLSRRQASARECVLDAHPEREAERTGQASIVVYGPGAYSPPIDARLQVWIDGEWVGELRRWLANEFAVEPGEHTVAISMAWLRSRPVPVLTGLGSPTELKIGGLSWTILLKWFLPMLVGAVALALIMVGLRFVGAIDDWSTRLALALSVTSLGGYLLGFSSPITGQCGRWSR